MRRYCGRDLEVQVEVPRPDESGRQQILQIQTRQLRQRRCLTERAAAALARCAGVRDDGLLGCGPRRLDALGDVVCLGALCGRRAAQRMGTGCRRRESGRGRSGRGGRGWIIGGRVRGHCARAALRRRRGGPSRGRRRSWASRARRPVAKEAAESVGARAEACEAHR